MQLRVEMKEAERVWLQELNRRSNAREPIDPLSMRIALRDKLPTDFRSSQVNHQFLSGNSLSLLGLVAIDPQSPRIRDTECVIKAIRDFIVETPQTRSVSAAQIAQRLGLEQGYTEQLFALMSSAGSFWSSAAGVPSGHGYSSITVDREENLQELLAFNSLETQLERRLVERRPGSDSFLGYFGDRSREDVKANTAFVIMQMSQSQPELEDVCNTIKAVCDRFGIHAARADDIEHQERITDVILECIRRSEHLIADLSGERPNVYYEVGYAHALNKKPILYRRAGTPLHFDLAVHNVPEYQNLTDLKTKLTTRFEAILGRSPASDRS